MSETAVVILVPEADRVVAKWQRPLTQAGRDGLGAHVTVLVPFAATHEVADRLSELKSAVAPFDAFDCTLAETGFFHVPGDILFLHPEPREIFVAMVANVLAAFPEFPAYGGEVSEIVPHLTIARVDADVGRLREIEMELARSLPIRARIDTITVVDRAARGWREFASIPLG